MIADATALPYSLEPDDDELLEDDLEFEDDFDDDDEDLDDDLEEVDAFEEEDIDLDEEEL
jgi:DNA-directed RNA polymerase subunit delta